MTTQNTEGTLTNRIILSAAFDPASESAPEYFPFASYILSADGKSAPHHWQDRVPDGIMDLTPYNTATANQAYGLQGVPTAGNEFELDVEDLTHTFTTVSVVAPLPGMTDAGSSGKHNDAQIRALNIDLGMMREIISVKGVLYDGDNHPSSTSGHHIRRQHLLDIARSQWANVHNFNRTTAFEWNNANKYPALTIGPMHGRETDTDEDDRDLGYYGDEPSNDVRGSEVTHTVFGPTQHPTTEWDYTFTYQGRRRYRGLIRRLTLQAIPGQPNIWRFNFDFEIIKNELELRIMATEDDDGSTGTDG